MPGEDDLGNATTVERPHSPSQRRRARSDGHSLRDRVVITATVLGVIIFVAVGLPYLKRDLPAEGLPVDTTGDLGADPDRDAVRGWIRTNYADPHPREVRWWPARTLDEFYRRQLAAAKEVAEDDPDFGDFVEQLEHDGPSRQAVRSTARGTKSEQKISHDDLFTFRGSRVRPVRGDSSEASAMRKYFPDDHGRAVFEPRALKANGRVSGDASTWVETLTETCPSRKFLLGGLEIHLHFVNLGRENHES